MKPELSCCCSSCSAVPPPEADPTRAHRSPEHVLGDDRRHLRVPREELLEQAAPAGAPALGAPSVEGRRAEEEDAAAAEGAEGAAEGVEELAVPGVEEEDVELLRRGAPGWAPDRPISTPNGTELDPNSTAD